MESIGVIIVAGGGGSRMGGTIPKQFRLLAGIPVLAHTINNFAAALPGARIVVALSKAHIDFWHNLAARFDIAPHKVVEGGEERFHSVRNGIAALPEEIELIAVQDGVRPLGSRELILRTIGAAREHGAAIPVVEPVDSFRKVAAESNTTECKGMSAEECTKKNDYAEDFVPSRIIDRRSLRIVQTPQVFQAELLREAYKAPYRAGFTDDASVAEAAGAMIFLCEGERGNVKITTPEDFAVAEAILSMRKEEQENGEHL